VNVLSSGERTNKSWIISEVGNAAKFDLVVVSDEKGTSLFGYESSSKNSTLIRAHRNVVQVWLVTTESTRSGHGLIKRGVDTAINSNFTKKTFPIRRTQLFNFAIPK
jgi:hypothetical protein